MSLNDQNLLNQSAKGSNIYPGIANPTTASGTTDPITSNFVGRPYPVLAPGVECPHKANNPTTPTKGAGAGPNFQGHRDAKHAMKGHHGVTESHPGILERTDARHNMKEHFGVIESHPGIIESTDIDPLKHETK